MTPPSYRAASRTCYTILNLARLRCARSARFCLASSLRASAISPSMILAWRRPASRHVIGFFFTRFIAALYPPAFCSSHPISRHVPQKTPLLIGSPQFRQRSACGAAAILPIALSFLKAVQHPVHPLVRTIERFRQWRRILVRVVHHRQHQLVVQYLTNQIAQQLALRHLTNPRRRSKIVQLIGRRTKMNVHFFLNCGSSQHNSAATPITTIRILSMSQIISVTAIPQSHFSSGK